MTGRKLCRYLSPKARRQFSRRHGWTLIEMLLAVGLAVVAAAIVTSVFHAVVSGLAEASGQAARKRSAVSVVEQIVAELEAGVCDDTAARLGGQGLRIDPGNVHDRLSGGSQIWFMTRLPELSESSEEQVAQIHYSLPPPEPGNDGRRLTRHQWTARDGTLPLQPNADNAVTEIVLPRAAGFRAAAWTTNGWHDAWPPPDSEDNIASPGLIRLEIALEYRGSMISATGFALRAISVLKP